MLVRFFLVIIIFLLSSQTDSLLASQKYPQIRNLRLHFIAEPLSVVEKEKLLQIILMIQKGFSCLFEPTSSNGEKVYFEYDRYNGLVLNYHKKDSNFLSCIFSSQATNNFILKFLFQLYSFPISKKLEFFLQQEVSKNNYIDDLLMIARFKMFEILMLQAKFDLTRSSDITFFWKNFLKIIIEKILKDLQNFEFS